MPELVLVAAVARNGIIGSEGDMPWKVSSDLKRFKKMTMGKPVVLGRKTFLSFGGRPLPGRPHVVVSRDPDYSPAGAEAVTSFQTALQRAEELANDLQAEEIMCIGGGQIYAQAMPQADRLEITEIQSDPDGDTSFPEIDPSIWEVTCREPGQKGEKDSADFVYVTYRRKAAS